LIKRAIITASLLLLCLLGGSCTSGQSLDAGINSIVKPYRFNIVGWEFEALSYELDELFFGSDEVTANEASVVMEYFSITEQIGTLNQEIGAVRSGLEPGDTDSLETELNKLQEQQDSLESRAEKIIEKQIRETLMQLGIFNPIDDCIGLEIGFPPVNFELEAPPQLLVISPRDRIESMREITLLPNVSPEEKEAIEAAIDELGVSSLVVGLGGIATYPAFVTNDAGLRFTVNAAIEEWLHQYLFFKPLGFMYALDLMGIFRNYEIATMNETLASMVSKEIGDILYQNYYAQYEEGSQTEATEEPEFDYNQEMREIRNTVDEYLAQGEIETAEAFMEQKRLYLASKGYYIRRLNQAYFAFYGTYADSPTSVSPIGVELKLLRDKSDSLEDFLDTVAVMTSRSELIDSIK
jgi:hypothetical protein